MEKDKIYVYSGTGNCLAASKQLAAELDMEVVHLTVELAENKTAISGERCIVVFPTYGYGLPKTVRKFLKSCTFQVQYMAVLTTIGSHHGGSLAEAIRLLKRRKQKVSYTKGIKTVENYVHMFGWSDDETVEKRQTMQKNITAQIAEDIKARKANKRCLCRPFSFFVACITRGASTLFAKRYKILSTCTGCGICAKVCPSRAITLSEQKKPCVAAKKCEHCQACLQLCPQQAIKFGRIKPGGKRYKHCDIEFKDMLKR